jgi:hypothetical protein
LNNRYFLLQKQVTKVIGVIAVLVIHVYAYGQSMYNHNNIHTALKKNNHAVLRNYTTNITIKNVHNATIVKTWVITILDKAGAQYGHLLEGYDKYYTVKKVICNVFNAEGKKIKSYKKKDIDDIAITDVNIDDIRYKKKEISFGFYPYTVEYTIEAVCNSLFALPNFMPIQDPGISFEKALLQIQWNKRDTNLIKCYVQPGNAIGIDSSIGSSSKAYFFKALVNNNAQLNIPNNSLAVFISAQKFYLHNLYGETTSWKAFGIFIDSLNATQQLLPLPLKTALHNITDTIIEPLQKIKVVYDYLMKYTFYKRIQLGLGGWQPANIADTWHKKYGDCKALSLLFKTCLQEIGIESYYTLVHTGKQPLFIPEFPANQFNHAIVTIPLTYKNLFIECTEKQNDIQQPAAHLQGAAGLVIKPNNPFIMAIQ